MYIVAKSGAPPSSCLSSSASVSTPPSGHNDVNSGHSIAISYPRPGYGFANVSSNSGLGIPEDRTGERGRATKLTRYQLSVIGFQLSAASGGRSLGRRRTD